MPTAPPRTVANTQYREVTGRNGYFVGDDGSVWSERSRNGRGSAVWREIKGKIVQGYVIITFHIPGTVNRRKRETAHSLVLREFVGERPRGLQICHRNGIANDNRLSNLYYGTAQENARDKALHGTQPKGDAHGMSKLTEELVAEIDRELESGSSLRSLASKHGMSTNAIRAIERGSTWGWQTGRSMVSRSHCLKPYRDGRLRASKYGSEGRVAILEWMISSARNQCPSCGLFASRKVNEHSDRALELDHKDPSGGDLVENMHVLCRRCNRLKNGFVSPSEVIGSWDSALILSMDAIDRMLGNPGWSLA